MTEDTGKKISEELKNDFTMDKLWAVLCLMQGERFYTARGLEFHYKIRGNEIFVDRKVNSKSITRSSVEMVFRKLQERRQGGEEFPLPVQGPKKLGGIRRQLSLSCSEKAGAGKTGIKEIKGYFSDAM